MNRSVNPGPNRSGGREAESVIDTSKMNRAQREALELTEAAPYRHGLPQLCGRLFMGRLALEHVYPFPLQPATDAEAGRSFLEQLNHVLKNEVDSDRIDAEGESPTG